MAVTRRLGELTAKRHFNIKILKWRDWLGLRINFLYTLDLKMVINFYLVEINSLANYKQLFPLSNPCSLVHITYWGEYTCPIKCQQYYFQKFCKTGLDYVCDFRARKKGIIVSNNMKNIPVSWPQLRCNVRKMLA